MRSLIKNLSGGEKSRLILAKILKEGGNFLILDEPTNDLDLPSLRILEEALVGFEGCVIVVSHDRYFLNRVCTHILAIEDDGTVFISPGDYDFYIKIKSGKGNDNAGVQTIDDKPVQKKSFGQLQELKKVVRQIEQAEKEVKKIEDIFGEPDFYIKQGDKIDEYTAQLAKARNKVNELYARWEELESN
jgi:ATP-binding cassette subfamily F protein uup